MIVVFPQFIPLPGGGVVVELLPGAPLRWVGVIPARRPQ